MLEFFGEEKRKMATRYERCPLCNSNIKLFRAPRDSGGKTWHIYRCVSCEVAFLNPMLEGAELDSYYDSDYYGPEHQRLHGAGESLIPLFRRARAKRIKKLIPPHGAVLDVGCGRGIMLAILQREGFKCVGVERSETSARSAKLAGVEVFAGDLQDVPFERESFDMITYWQVLEHIENPLQALKRSFELLKPQGKLLLQVPNVDGFQSLLSRDHWFHLDPPRHLWHFNARSLDYLAQKCGFSLLKRSHFSLEYGPFGILQSLMNMMGIKRDSLFGLMMGTADNVPFTTKALLWTSAGILGAPAFVMEAIASLFQRGAVLEAIYIKKNF